MCAKRCEISFSKEKAGLGLRPVRLFYSRGNRLTLGDNPYGVNNSWYIAADGQQHIQPEGAAKAYLKKYAQRWQEYGDKNANKIHGIES